MSYRTGWEDNERTKLTVCADDVLILMAENYFQNPSADLWLFQTCKTYLILHPGFRKHKTLL